MNFKLIGRVVLLLQLVVIVQTNQTHDLSLPFEKSNELQDVHLIDHSRQLSDTSKAKTTTTKNEPSKTDSKTTPKTDTKSSEPPASPPISSAAIQYPLPLNQDDPSEPILSPFCHKLLLNSYGYIGMDLPILQPLSFCPGIERSCCTAADELNHFKLVKIKEKQNRLLRNSSNFVLIYNELILAMNRVAKFAESAQTTFKNTLNCRILSSNIARFKFDSVSSAFKDLHVKYFEQHSKQFDGLFCTLCDADSSPFIDLSRQTVRMNAAQCRYTVNSSLHFLRTYHINLPALLNEMVLFANNCDANGAYTSNQIDQTKYRINNSYKHRKMLKQCSANIDTPNWLTSCLPICQKISLTRFDEFFRPHVLKFPQITELLNLNMQRIENQVASGVAGAAAAATASSKPASPAGSPAAPVTPTSKRRRQLRMLSEQRAHRRLYRHTGVDHVPKHRSFFRKMQQQTAPTASNPLASVKQELKALKQRVVSDVVIRPALGAEVDLNRFQTVISDPYGNPDPYTKLLEWQLTAMDKDVTKDSKSGTIDIPKGYSPIKLGGINPLLVARYTIITTPALTKAKEMYIAEAQKAKEIQKQKELEALQDQKNLKSQSIVTGSALNALIMISIPAVTSLILSIIS